MNTNFFEDWSTQLSRNSLSASINHEWFSHNFDAFIDSGGDETAVDNKLVMFDRRKIMKQITAIVTCMREPIQD